MFTSTSRPTATLRIFLRVMESFGFQQHVKTPTHRCGHLLDLILTRPELCINVLPVDPPTLSDHLFVVAQLPMIAPQPAATTRVVRERRRLDVDEFAHDLAASDLFRSPPIGTYAAFELYDRTLRQLVDKHVPLTVRLRRNARWYDADCRTPRRTTRRLETDALIICGPQRARKISTQLTSSAFDFLYPLAEATVT
jgi:hypothetical protein